jgi:hypothetical protein
MANPLIPEMSAALRARISGALYVLCIACGFFAEMIVRAKLVVYSDAAATAHNIAAAPGLYRAGFFADVSAMTLGVLSSVLFYTLFKVVSRGIALTVLVLDVISNAVSISGSFLLFAPLLILQGDGYLSALTTAQLSALALLSIKLYETAYAISLGLFSGSCLLSGYLIFRSTFLPRFLGVLLALAGICYLVNTLVALMPKGFGEYLFPWIFLPILVGEGVLALWLLIVGINSAKWDAIARAQGSRDGVA